MDHSTRAKQRRRKGGRFAAFTPEERDREYWVRVEKKGPDECWPWLGSFSEGYGMVPWTTAGKGESRRAHRYPYEKLHGPIPRDLVPDHKCRHRWCQNPGHLELISSGANVLRGEGITAKHARATHCKRGHPKTPENTLVRTSRHYAYKRCKICDREAHRARYEREKAARSPK